MLKDVDKATSCYIDSITISDHAPLVFSLVLDKSCSLNNLLNLSVVQKIKLEWKDYLDYNNNGHISASTLWEAAKVVIRGKLIALSKIKKGRIKEQQKLENYFRLRKRALGDGSRKYLSSFKEVQTRA